MEYLNPNSYRFYQLIISKIAQLTSILWLILTKFQIETITI